MKFLDTNIVIRFLVRDDDVKAGACLELLQRVERGEEEITTSESVIAEIVYVLSSPRLYALSPEDIRARLVPILSLRGLRLPAKRLYVRALDIYCEYSSLDFEDALSVAHLEREGITTMLSYDIGFDLVHGIIREEP